MSTCLQVLKSAYRKANLLSMASTVEGTELDSLLSSIGMERIQDFYSNLAWNGGLNRLEDYYATGDYEALENQRIYNDGAYTITIPTTFTDLETGATRGARDKSVIITVASASPNTIVTKVYDIAYGWITIDALTAAGYAPFTKAHNAHITAMLAEHLAAEDGTPITDLLKREAALAKQAVANKYGGTRKTGKFEFF